uniref:Insulin-like domain-containing protein n=1 Tax=Athene cunicularia TaxID=194338 RepID=A0A663NDA3_ATHCN
AKRIVFFHSYIGSCLRTIFAYLVQYLALLTFVLCMMLVCMTVHGRGLQSILSPEVEQLQRSSPFLGWEMYKDFYSLNDYNEYVPVADDFKELVQQVEEAVSSPADRGGTGIADHMGSNSYLWARYPRRKRESLGLAGMCCKWGCTKAEISTICRV